MFEIELYELEEGNSPVKKFIYSQESKMFAKILWSINLLQVNGDNLREPYSKSLSNGIFELRIAQGSDITRILYFFVMGHRIVLTNGFVKKKNKTPKSEIELAKKYREDYLRRFSHD